LLLVWKQRRLPVFLLPLYSNLSPMEREEITPSLYSVTTLDENDKERVRNADPNGGRCLISNAISPINYCHCIPRHIMNEKETVRVYKIHRYLF
jgi:hypothetical protein